MHQLLKQLCQRLFWIYTQPWMHGRGLDYGAAGGGEPAEAGGNGQLANGAAVGFTLANPLKSMQALAELVQVKVGAGKGAEAGLVKGGFGAQIALGGAVQYYAYVHKLLALYARHHPNYGVLKQVLVGHGWLRL